MKLILKLGLAALLVALLAVPVAGTRTWGRRNQPSSESYREPQAAPSPAPKVEHQDITVQKYIDKSSPKLMENTGPQTGSPVPPSGVKGAATSQPTQSKAGKGQRPFLKYELKGVGIITK